MRRQVTEHHKGLFVPSLGKLQTLDESHAKPVDRLCAAAQIAGISLSASVPNADSFSRARTEWVLRWLAEKLKPGKVDEGRQFRACALTWQLLKVICRVLAVNSVASLLASATIFHTVQTTLKEWLADSHSLQTFQYVNGTLPDIGAVSAQPVSKNKKRKRSTEDVLNSSDGLHTAASLKERLDAICQFLLALRDCAFEKEADDAPQSGHACLRSLIRIDTKSASALLATGLTCIVRLYRLHKALDARNVECFTSIWHHRALSGTETPSMSAMIFAEECLVPVCLLCGSLLDATNKVDTFDVLIVTEKLRRLLLKNVVHVAHISFFQSPLDKSKTESTEPSLEARLSSLREAIAFLKDSQGTQEFNALIAALPLIFETALQNSSRVTPKQQLRELPWLESVFQGAMSCIGAPFVRAVPSGAGNQVLIKLVLLANEHRITLSTSYMRQLIAQYSGLSDPPPSAVVDWRLVELLMDMNSDLLIDTTKSEDLSTSITAHISAVGVNTTNPPDQCVLAKDQDSIDSLSHMTICLLRAYARQKQITRFAEIWFAQLINAASTLGPGKLDQSLWTQSDLIEAFGTTLQSFIVGSEGRELLQNILIPPIVLALSNLDIIGGQEQAAGSKSNEFINALYAAIVITEAVLLGFVSNESLLQSRHEFDTIWNVLQKLVVADLPALELLPHIWRILTRLRQHQRDLYPSNIEFRDDAKYLMLPAFMETAIRKATTSSKLEPDVVSATQRSAYLFLMTVCSQMVGDSQVVLDVHDTMAKSSTAYFTTLTASWNGKRTGTSSRSLDYRITDLQILSAYPEILSFVGDQLRRDIIRGLLFTADDTVDEGWMTVDKLSTQLASELFNLQDSLALLIDSKVLVAWMRMILGPFDKEKLEIDNEFLDQLVLAVSIDGRNKLAIDYVSHWTIAALAIKEGRHALALTLLHKLVRMSRWPSIITNDSEFLFIMAACIKDQDDKQVVALFDTLVRSLFSKLSSESNQIETRRYVQAFDKEVADLSRRNDKSGVFRGDTIGLWIILKHRLAYSENNSSKVGKKSGGLPVMAEHVALVLISLTADCIDISLHSPMSDHRELFSQPNNACLLNVAHLLQAHYLPLAVVQNRLFPLLAEVALPLEDERNSVSYTNNFPHAFACVSKADSHKALSLVLSLQVQAQTTALTPDQCASRSSAISIIDRSAIADVELDIAKQVLPAIAEQILQATAIHTVGYALADINTILESKPSLNTQYGVETVLDAVGALLSLQQFNFLHQHASSTYNRLCQILNNLLSLHRRNLSGRMHVLIPLVQTLLNPFLNMHASSRPTSNQQPPIWLRGKTEVMKTSHAIAFTRLVLTMTQPTVTSATLHYRSSNKPLLTDETRKARQYVARFAPYVLAHFCSLQLIGRVTPDIRKALLPGIWACIEVIPREGLRGMNASLGREERAIWSSLFAEWTRSQSKAS